uniref:7TM_GPCR_Srx domain-containing protein n=1 Tax=Parastrongyloides trichosuri TaxID=131310 RepID=A0A0N4Z412_PARTI
MDNNIPSNLSNDGRSNDFDINYYGDYDYSLDDLSSGTSRISFCVVCSVICFSFILLQAFNFYVYYKNRNILTSLVYSIIKHLGIISFIQQVSQIQTGIIALFAIDSRNTIVRLTGAQVLSSYTISTMFHFLLTLNRCDVFYNQVFFPKINRNVFFKLIIILFYFLFAIQTAFYVTPEYRVSFFNAEYFWFSYGTSKYAYLSDYIQPFISVFMLSLSTILYLLIIGRIYYIKNFRVSSREKVSFQDIKLLIQGGCSYICMVILEVLWVAVLFTHNPSIILTLFANFFLVVNCGCNTLLSLFLIDDIKDEFIIFIQGKKKDNKVDNQKKVQIKKTIRTF